MFSITFKGQLFRLIKNNVKWMTLVMGFSSWSNINKYVTIKRFGLNNGRRNSNQSITKYFWLYLLFFEKSLSLSLSLSLSRSRSRSPSPSPSPSLSLSLVCVCVCISGVCVCVYFFICLSHMTVWFQNTLDQFQ